MKQVKFGSFPLAEILPKDRECLDKYLIRHFADSISFKDTLTNLSITKNTFYVGPAEIVRGMMNRSGTSGASGYSTHRYDNQSSQNSQDALKYLQVQKRAFAVMEKFYTELTKSSFYKGLTYYPIYIEKVDKSMRPDVASKSSGTITQRFSYSFILLTNDLLSDTDRPVNEAGVINFLYIYLHLFHSPFLMSENNSYHIKSNTGLASIDNDSIVLVMRFYKLIQKYDLNPIQVFLSIYNLINEARNFIQDKSINGVINQPQSKFKAALGNRLMSKTSKFDNPHFKNILKKVVDNMVNLYTKGLSNTNTVTQNSIKDNAKVMLSIVELMLDEREIYDFVENLNDRRETRDSRIQAVADYHHYQDIIGLFEALAHFNNLGISDIIKETSINFGSNIILDNDSLDESERISKLVGVIDTSDFDSAFNKFFKEIENYIYNLSANIIEPKFKEALAAKNKRITDGIDRLRRELENAEIEKDQVLAEIQTKQVIIDKLQNLGVRLSQTEIDTLNQNLVDIKYLNLRLQDANHQITERSSALNLYESANKLEKEDTAYNQKILGSLSTRIFNNLDDALGFIYKDLENLFLNPIVLDQILNKGGKYNFDSIPQDASSLKRTLLEHPYSSGAETSHDDIVKSAYIQLNEDVEFLVETIVQEINNISSGYGDQYKNAIREAITNALGLRFFGIMKKHLRNIHGSLNKILEYNSKMQGIHPLLGKMARDPKNFKTFILSTNVLSTLYNLIFITQEKMFLSGLLKRPPKKLNGSTLQSRFVINNILGLQNNPTWIIGENKIRLNLPDFLSLTGAPLQSEIPKSKLQNICKVDYKKFSWKSEYMGNLIPEIEDSPEIKKIKNKIKLLSEKISDLTKKGNLTDSDKNTLNKLRNEETKAKDELIQTIAKFGGTSLGNMGKVLDSDNYIGFKNNNFNSSNITQEEFSTLSPLEKEELGIIDPKANELDHGMDSTQNQNLEYLRQSAPGVPGTVGAPTVGTANIGDYGDSIRAQMWNDKIRGRQVL